MAARVWFKADNTHGLTEQDLRVLNTAARHAFPPDREPSNFELMTLRGEYKAGMSAADLLAACEMED